MRALKMPTTIRTLNEIFTLNDDIFAKRYLVFSIHFIIINHKRQSLTRPILVHPSPIPRYNQSPPSLCPEPRLLHDSGRTPPADAPVEAPVVGLCDAGPGFRMAVP
jgi:hypothetical protein